MKKEVHEVSFVENNYIRSEICIQPCGVTLVDIITTSYPMYVTLLTFFLFDHKIILSVSTKYSLKGREDALAIL